jgi:REP element-mobilizing transposase RayT
MRHHHVGPCKGRVFREKQMSQTLVKNLLHIVFSTKNRDDLIRPEIEEELFAYMTTIIKNCDSRLLAINGTTNHVHLLISLSKNWAIAPVLENLKKDSSRWIKTKGHEFRDFYWQNGYGAFSVGESQVAAVKHYIARQKEHHQRISFQDEFVAILKKYNLDYDAQYIWT